MRLETAAFNIRHFASSGLRYASSVVALCVACVCVADLTQFRSLLDARLIDAGVVDGVNSSSSPGKKYQDPCAEG